MGFSEKLLHVHLRANTWMSVIDQATVLLAHQPLVGNAGPRQYLTTDSRVDMPIVQPCCDLVDLKRHDVKLDTGRHLVETFEHSWQQRNFAQIRQGKTKTSL